jgi:glutaredoxin
LEQLAATAGRIVPAVRSWRGRINSTERKGKITMSQKHKIEIFSAGCAMCNETIASVKEAAGPGHEVQVHDMHQQEVARRAKEHGIRSLPAVVVNGKLAGCCAGRGPDELVLREALR